MTRAVFISFSARTRNAWLRSAGAWVKAAASACSGRTNSPPPPSLNQSHGARSMLKNRVSLYLFPVFLTLLAVPIRAQVSAAISGKVEDPSGAVVRGANVTVKNLETGATRVVTTDEDGNFR